MAYCLNPDCQKPTSNPQGTKFCQNCGSKLLLSDRYRAIKLIGEGGFGRTFLAVDEYKPSKPRCVIKQFFYQGAGAKIAVELFEQEAVRLDDLGKHPQIPELFAHFEVDKRQYLVQEFIDGQNLAQALEAEGAFSETQIRDLLNNLLPVLDFIHSHNIIHRDIKPENIIRRFPQGGSPSPGSTKTDELVLVDFGAAKFVSAAAFPRTGTKIGTAEYSAPEQMMGKAEFGSDLYSLAVTCIHLLTQMHPFDLFSISEDAWVWRDYLHTPLQERNLGKVLDKMLERATSRRYRSAQEILEELNPQPTAIKNWSNSIPLGNLYGNVNTPSPIPNQQLPIANYRSPITYIQSATLVKNWRCDRTLIGHSNWVWSVAFSPDSKTLASGSRDKTIKLWDLQTGKQIRTLWGHSNWVWSVAFSPDGKTLVSGSGDKTLKVWQIPSGKIIRTLEGHSGPIYAIAFSPDGRTIASGSGDKTLKIWDCSSNEAIHTLTRHLFWVRCIAISPDGQTLASGGLDNNIHLWHINSGRWSRTFAGHSNWVRFIAFSSDGQFLASASYDKSIKVWDLYSGKEIYTLSEHTDLVGCVAISPDGQILASSSRDKTIKLWQLSTGREISNITERSDAVSYITFSPDGQSLATANFDGTINIWRCD
ncbi:protein kinase domain-containing protein [Aerosakkonema funiforme]|uniref:protein kinase domain-containing protein n=1 Tax=Aerosakkonema funiforme TaxID=1246630 RepID=UPI0035BAAB68